MVFIFNSMTLLSDWDSKFQILCESFFFNSTNVYFIGKAENRLQLHHPSFRSDPLFKSLIFGLLLIFVLNLILKNIALKYLS